MKILVPTKRVPDTDQRIQVADDGHSINDAALPFIVNPFDAIAIEEALRIGEAQGDVEVVAVGIGGESYEEQLRTAMAMGADRSLLVRCDDSLDPWSVATILKAVVQREQPDLVMMGKQAVDDDSNQAGQFLAALLDWPQATFASSVTLEDGKAQVARETDLGIETVRVQLPAVITADLRLNEPRYASLPSIMKARKKLIEQVELGELGVEVAPRVEVVAFEGVSMQRTCTRVTSTDELLDCLRQEEVI